jgi:transposase
MGRSSDISSLQAQVAQLFVELAQLRQENAVLRQENVDLKQKVSDLKAQLNQNSRNSHRPPSSDGLKKRPALPKKKPKKRGGQRGHQGSTLKMVELADERLEVKAESCPHCSESLSGSDIVWVAGAKRQEFDLPEPKLHVREYQVYRCSCPHCGTDVESEFPAGIKSAVQYGPGVRAWSTLLSVEYKLPYKKIRQFFADLFGYDLNEATALDATHRCYRALEETEAHIGRQLLESERAHFDETGLRVEGKNHWLHVASNALWTHLFIHPKRGKKALSDEQSIIKDFPGWAVHDSWASYFCYEGAQHALCGAHLLRELQDCIERGSNWARSMHRYLMALYRMSKQGEASLTEELFQKASRLFDRIIEEAEREEPSPTRKVKTGRAKATKGRNLFERMQKRKSAVLAFVQHPEVPFTNNQAERDLRHAKIKTKVATSFRTLKGAQVYARIAAAISTFRKQQMNPFDQLRFLFEGKQVVWAK